ncbi:MAG: ATP-binding protein [Desulfurococcales archaeon]|jgi:DNA helicase HerA-like ATPase|nr:ATP-binding protein [Desulfurococcales archaeon]
MSLPILGRVLRSRSPSFCEVYSDYPMPVGSYVYAEFRVMDKATGSQVVRRVVGVVSNSSYSPIIERPSITDLKEEISHDYTVPSISIIELYIIADISAKRPETPRYPLPPGTAIYPAPPEYLRTLYELPEEGYIRLGSLSEYSGIEIRVRVNELSRHFLITGATGSGKSNTVAIIADRLSRLGAPVAIFDVHGEYVGLQPEDGDPSRVRVYGAVISPYKIPPKILASMIIRDPAATKQRRLLTRALRNVNKAISDKCLKGFGVSSAVKEILVDRKIEMGETLDEDYRETPEDIYLALLIHEIYAIASRNKKVFDEKVTSNAIEKVEDFFESSPVDLEAPRIIDMVEPGRISVIDVSTLSDDQKAWILKLYSDELLSHLKEGIDKSGSRIPTVLIVEEAPLFLPADASTPAKESLQRFAREGRKFGGVLGIVSQRPRSLDPNVASQLQNFVFLKLVQEEDRRAVMNIADALEDTLAEILPSLPKGRAIVMGEWVGRFPVLVDIDIHSGKKRGATPDLYGIWRSRSRVNGPKEERFEI